MATIGKIERSLYAAIVFPFIVMIRFPMLCFNALMLPAFVIGWLGPWKVSVMLCVGAVVVSSVNVGASLERIRRR